MDIAAEDDFGFVGQLVTENLTPGGKLSDYSDGEIFRALRHGIDSEGRRLLMMSLISAGELSDSRPAGTDCLHALAGAGYDQRRDG